MKGGDGKNSMEGGREGGKEMMEGFTMLFILPS